MQQGKKDSSAIMRHMCSYKSLYYAKWHNKIHRDYESTGLQAQYSKTVSDTLKTTTTWDSNKTVVQFYTH